MNSIYINSDAIFVSDSHTQDDRVELIVWLESLLSNPPSQVFLMGDISNLLIGAINSSVVKNNILIEAIENLSRKSQIFYFEGNHDFSLEGLFEYVIVIPRTSQPLLCYYEANTILLSHGDILLDTYYEAYIRILNSKPLLVFLGIIDKISCSLLYKFAHKKVSKKTIKLPQMQCINTIAKSRICAYKKYIKKLGVSIDMVIEGHYHIGKIFEYDGLKYVSLPSFLKKEVFYINKSEIKSV